MILFELVLWGVAVFATFVALPEWPRWRLERQLRRGLLQSVRLSSPTQLKLERFLRERPDCRVPFADVRVWISDASVTTFVVERLSLHLVVSQNDPLVHWLDDKSMSDDTNPFWFVLAHEHAHLRFSDIQVLRALGVAIFAIVTLVGAFAGLWWGCATAFVLRVVWNHESCRLERRADELAFSSASLARGALTYFAAIKLGYHSFRNRMGWLGRLVVTREGRCRLDFLHPSITERLDATLRALRTVEPFSAFASRTQLVVVVPSRDLA